MLMRKKAFPNTDPDQCAKNIREKQYAAMNDEDCADEELKFYLNNSLVVQEYTRYSANMLITKKSTEEAYILRYDDKVIHDKYMVLGGIGKGSFGEVYLVQETDPNSRGVEKVLKRIAFPNINQLNANYDPEREIEALRQLAHKNIVKYLDGQMIDVNTVYIIMEYCKNGDLAELIQKSNAIPESKIIQYTIETLEGLSYLHELKFIHRDIKPANLLLDSDGHIRIADFGMTRTVEQVKKMGTYYGTINYMSPEMASVITGKKDPKKYSEKTDIWSFGCVFYEMSSLQKLFVGEISLKIAEAICGYKLKDQLKHIRYSDPILKRSLVKEEKRVSAEDLLKEFKSKAGNYVQSSINLSSKHKRTLILYP